MYRGDVPENPDCLDQLPNARSDHGLPSADRNQSIKTIFAGKRAEIFSAGKAIFWERNEAEDLFWVVSGHAQLYKTLNDGRRAVTRFIYPNELFGLSFTSQCLVSGEALSELKLLRISRRQFHEIINTSPSLQSEVSMLISDDFETAIDHVMLLARMKAEERVARFIVDIYRRSAIGSEIILPMKRSDIADYLGLTVETISRVAASLQRKGLIRTGQLGHRVEVFDLRALSEIAQMGE